MGSFDLVKGLPMAVPLDPGALAWPLSGNVGLGGLFVVVGSRAFPIFLSQSVLGLGVFGSPLGLLACLSSFPPRTVGGIPPLEDMGDPFCLGLVVVL